eukprot:g7823.t1
MLVYRLLATLDATLIASLFGIPPIPSKREDLDAIAIGHGRFVLLRRAGTGMTECDGFRTNKNYIPRQLELLEFLLTHEDLMINFSELAAFSGISELDLENRFYRFQGSMPFARPEALIAFFQSKTGLRGAQTSLFAGNSLQTIDLMKRSVNVKQQNLHKDSKKKRVRKQRQCLIGLGESDIHLYEAAFAELFQFQRTILKLPPLDESPLLHKELVSSLKARAREATRFDKIDKGSNIIRAYPSRQDISELLTKWREVGDSPMKAYSGVMNASMWLTATQGGCQRFDCVHRILYSDREVVRADAFADDGHSPEGIQVFLIKSRMSKTNRNGALCYSSMISHMQVRLCPIFHEACLVILKHDLIGVKIPQFSLVTKVTGSGEAFYIRPWYLDFIFSIVLSKGAPKLFKFNNVVLKDVDGSMKTAIAYKTAYSAFDKAYANLGFANSAVMHLPRKLQTIQNGFNQVPLEETCRVGH